MALWPLRAQASVDHVQASARPMDLAPLVASPRSWEELATGGLDSPVSRKDAMAVPAVARALDLITTTVAGLPWEHLVTDPETGKKTRTPLSTFMEQPESNRPRYATIIDTARDLIMDGRAYWIVRERYADGYPRSVKYAPLGDVSVFADDWGDTLRVTYRGRDVNPRDVIAFEGWHDGIRNHGARIIRTALALEAAARRYADAPLPSLIVSNQSGYELSPSEVQELLDGVKKARQASSVGYVNAGAKLDTMGWSSEQIQLVEARVFTNAALANLCGIPAHFIAASNVGGSSLTYANASQEARTLIDYGMKPLLTALESRLGMADVTPRGHTVRLELDAMLRGNPMERSQLYHSLIPLGVLTVQEARDWEDLTPHAETPEPATTPEP